MSDPTEVPSNVLRLVKRKRALSDAHRAHLRTSGLTDESIEAGGFWTERDPREIAGLLHWRGWPKGKGDVLALPFYLPDSSEPYLVRVRPDQPNTNEKTGKIRKYEQPKDTPMGPYFPVRSRVHRWLDDVTRDLILIEGEKKAALADQLGYAVVGSTGVDCFHDKPFRDDTDQYRLHELIRKYARIEGRRCLVAFDSDAAENEHVMRAARVLAWMLTQAGAREVLLVHIPSEQGAKLGLDDYFVRHGEEAARKLLAESLEAIEPLSGEDSRSLLKNYRQLAGLPVSERLRMPRGYDIERDGSLAFLDGERNETVERAPIFIKRLVADHYSGHELAELVFRRDRTWRTVVVPRRAIADSRAALSELSPLGAPIDSNTSSKVVKWLRDFEATNDKRLPKATSVACCGWHRIGDDDVFVLNEPISREGTSIDLVVDRQHERARLSRALHSSGTYEEHLTILRQAWDASPICAAVIAGALVAPMLRPLCAPLFAIHLAGDSSRGKSTMLRIAASLYGNPRDDEWVTSWNATAVGHEVRAAFLCDLPLPIDEAGVVEARDRERAVYMLVNGVGRTRGAKEGGLRETHSWRTVVLSTGERLLAEEANATGAQVRILQLHVDGFGVLGATGVDALGRGVAEHYGHIGREWIEALLEVSQDDWQAHRAALKSRAREFQALAEGSTLRARQAGFWALLAHAEDSAYQTLGIGRPGGATMRILFENSGEAQVEVRPAADRAIDAVREWIITNPAGFPRVVVSTDGRKVARGELSAREVHGYIDGGELLLVPGALRTMLSGHGIADAVALREWRDRGWLRTGGDSESRFTVQVRVGGKKPRLLALKGDIVGLDDSGFAESGDFS